MKKKRLQKEVHLKTNFTMKLGIPSVAIFCCILCFGAVHTIAAPDDESRAKSPGSGNRDRRIQETCNQIPPSNMDNAWKVIRKEAATGMIVYQNGAKIFEEYDQTNLCPYCWSAIGRFFYGIFGGDNRRGGAADEDYNMFSQTKSLAGIAAVLLVKQGLLQLNDPASMYITQWKDDSDKKDITVEELLTLSSGIETSNVLPSQANLEDFIASPFVGKQFAYGSQPFVLFAHIVKVITSLDVEDYLRQELFSKIDMDLAIDKIQDGTELSGLAAAGHGTLRSVQTLATEIMLAALGEGKVLDNEDIMLFTTAGLNPAYGLSFWLNEDFTDPNGNDLFSSGVPQCGPTEAFYMIGVGGQVAVMVPSLRLVAVKSEKISALSTALSLALGGMLPSSEGPTFFSELFSGVPCQCS